MAHPEITVLMTVYNGGAYLKMAVESVLKQTFTDFEFLIIDDCSLDQSRETILSFKDERIKLIKNEINLGQTRSLNKGLALAQGRYIARIDADDFVFSSWLEKTLALLKAQPLTAVVSCKAIVVDEQHKIRKTLRTGCCYAQMVLRSLTATPLNHVGALYKVDVISSVGGYDETFKIAADFELWSRLIRRRIQLACIDEPLVAIRVHAKSESMIQRGQIDMIEISEVMKRNFDVLIAFEISRPEIELLWKLHYATIQLSAVEFQDAFMLLCKAYRTMKAEFAVSSDAVEAFIAHQKKVFYAKRALGQMAQGQLPQLRVLAKDYCKTEGWLNLLSLVWLGTWLGKPALRNLPIIYERWRGWIARKKLPHQVYSECVR
ncbi:MAG: glycosyltransferase [Candidatus Omnitrophica bacterium]|nr:glycosyltransferase [Candidatus Omnitrophota bacterium]